MKYKAGDKVRVRKDLEAEIEYGNFYFNYDMEKMRGKIVTIERKNENHYELKNHYEIKEDNNVWCWTDEMLEPVEDIIEYKGKKYDVEEITNDYDYDGRKTYSLELTEHKEVDNKIEKLEHYNITDETISGLRTTLNVLHKDYENKINELIDEVNKLKEK